LIIVGFADSVEMGAFLAASGRFNASSAAASANEIDAKAIDRSKKAHFNLSKATDAPHAQTQRRNLLNFANPR
jgi:hypothetical protein